MYIHGRDQFQVMECFLHREYCLRVCRIFVSSMHRAGAVRTTPHIAPLWCKHYVCCSVDGWMTVDGNVRLCQVPRHRLLVVAFSRPMVAARKWPHLQTAQAIGCRWWVCLVIGAGTLIFKWHRMMKRCLRHVSVLRL